MRDKKRINRILSKIKKIWSENPDLRFNQLMVNINLNNSKSMSNDCYYTEDDAFERALDSTIKIIKDLK